MSYFKTGFHTTFSKSKLPEMNSPYLLCGFPGSGYVGKLSCGLPHQGAKCHSLSGHILI